MSQFFKSGGKFSFSINPSNEYSGLISFRMDWVDLLESPKDSQESSPTPQFKCINSSALSFLYSPTPTSIHDYWKKIITLTRRTFVSKIMSLLFNMQFLICFCMLSTFSIRTLNILTIVLNSPSDSSNSYVIEMF